MRWMGSRGRKGVKSPFVYEIDCSWNVTCVVINLAPPMDRNWLWELLRGERTRWKRGSISAILKTIEQRLKKMGTLDPEIEAFETEIIEYWLWELPPEKRFLGLDLEKTDEVKALVDKRIEKGIEQGIEQGRIAGKMIVAGKTDQEIAGVTKLPLKTIAALRQKIETED